MPLPLSPAVRRLLGAFASVVVAAFLVTGLSGPAHAATGYRYWNYSHLKAGSWQFSKVGAGQYKPADGAVEGYRYGTSTVSRGISPRTDPAKVTFATVCGAAKAGAGQKRVAVVIDYGTAADAAGQSVPDPVARCAVVPDGANGQQALQSVAKVRTSKGLICGLNGYPVKGCGEPVPNATVPSHEKAVAFQLPASAVSASPSQATSATPLAKTAGSKTAAAKAAKRTAASQNDGTSSRTWPLVGIVVVVLVIAGAALALNRRRDS